MKTNERRERQTVVVTGATACLGRSIARTFAECAAQVALLARGKDGLASTS